MEAAPIPTRHRFRALDGWRGVCAILVVLFHLNAATHVQALTRNGYASVDFFFILSGFVLMSAFETRIGDLPALGRYAWRRLARLYPLHLVTLLATVVLVGVGALRTDAPMFEGAHGFPALIENLLLIHGLTVHQLSWNFPSWSASVELWASLLFGATLFLSRSRSWLAVCALCVALSAILVGLGEPAGPAVNEEGVLLKVAHYVLAFFAGAALFKLFAWLSLRRYAPPPWAELLATGLIAVSFLLADKLPALATIALFGVAILIFAFDGGLISRRLQTGAFQGLGRWSYSIYLIHPFWTLATYQAVIAAGHASGQVASVVDATGEHLILGGPFLMDVAAFVCLALVVGTAALSFRFIERPGQSWMLRLMSHRQDADPASSVAMPRA